jgi:hypothetical protein
MTVAERLLVCINGDGGADLVEGGLGSDELGDGHGRRSWPSFLV